MNENQEKYSISEIREAFVLFASGDEWDVPHFYESGLVAALRGEYDDGDYRAKYRLTGKLPCTCGTDDAYHRSYCALLR